VKIRIPRSPAALETIWKALPAPTVWFWTLTGLLPSLAEQLDQLEAERAAEQQQ